MTQNEYIIPLTPRIKSLSLYRHIPTEAETIGIKQQIPSMDGSVSIRPQLAITEKEIQDRLAQSSIYWSPFVICSCL